ncbi:hypothetical protein [Acuticoccus sediminis]|uniref:hypothetical protein n=1 Tax=Acuticoccus sediminis TaxID=2184697 RepID=UPI001CFF434B|nr:hypothetical protein [Acuticoccus sediminis]
MQTQNIEARRRAAAEQAIREDGLPCDVDTFLRIQDALQSGNEAEAIRLVLGWSVH